MVEYLVVLGVTTLVIVATMTDVGAIFDRIKSNYSEQSRQMNRVQLYDSYRTRFSEVAPGAGTDIDDPTGDAPVPPIPGPPLELAMLDDMGNQIGRLVGDKYVDEAGQVVATCDEYGVCTDNDGNQVQPTPVDSRGKPLPLQAVYDSAGNLLGFAYYTNGTYYHPFSYQAMTVPSNVTLAPREEANVLYVGSSKSPAGYETRGRIFTTTTVMVQSGLTGNLLATDEQLVSVEFATPPAGWNISQCVVLTNAQVADVSTITIGGIGTPVAVLGASGKDALEKPEALRYAKVSSADCRASKQVTPYPSGHWVITDK